MVMVDVPELPAETVRLVAANVNEPLDELVEEPTATTADPVEPAYVGTPTAFGVFAHQTVSEGEPPRSYLERLYNIQRWTVFPRGGHFAPAEEPAAVAGDLNAFFHGLT